MLNTNNINESLRKFCPNDWEWKFALYSVHKTGDGVELDWDLCKMKGIADWVETLRTVLLEKTFAERLVADYSPLLPKENISSIPKDAAIIKSQLWDTIANITNGFEYAPEDFISGTAAKPVGYGFYGFRKDDSGNVTHETLFIRRANPFLSGQRVRLCTADSGEVVISDKPLLKFMPNTDFLLFDDTCYFFSQSIEKDFDLENRNYAITAVCMKTIGEANIVSNFEQFEKATYTAKNTRKFMNFDRQIFEYIVRLTIVEREDFLLKYGITIDKEGRMSSYEAEQSDMIIDLLCGRSCLDALGRLAVCSNITPRV